METNETTAQNPQHAKGERVVVGGKTGTVRAVKANGQVMVQFDHRMNHKPSPIHPTHVQKVQR